MTVLDTSGVIDLLLGSGSCRQVSDLIAAEGAIAAPDLLVFEVLAVLRRLALAGTLDEPRAVAAIEDLRDLPLELFPSLPLAERAFARRANFTAADALFLALAEELDEPLATADVALARAAGQHGRVAVIALC